MRQLIAIIVAVCLLISSCSVQNVRPNKIEIPRQELKIDFVINNDPIQFTRIPVVDTSEVNCIAKGIYYEASGEPTKGKEAVGLVIMNRTQMSRFPKTACGVVKQAVTAKGAKFCQFSWYCQGGDAKLTADIRNKAYDECYRIAQQIVMGRVDNFMPGAVAFHVSTVNAGWGSNGLVKVTQIGNHVFYRFKT